MGISFSFTARFWQRTALLLILLLAVFLNFYNLAQESYANLYYAAGVYSMGQSWHAFFFNSFDPVGFVTIDKPPLGFWLQVLSTKLFGFYGWALILPQALAGVLSVALLYYLVRRIFGVNAGLLAALLLALTPISVAVNRNNTMDSVLVFTSLLAAWAVILAAERGKLRWLLLSALLVGLGFEIKMLQAFLVLPAFYLVYFFTANTSWLRRCIHLVLATLVIAVVSLVWPLAVDLTPAENRPYVGSSEDNTVIELIVGHNGTKRMGQIAGILGLQAGGSGDRPRPDDDPTAFNLQPPVALTSGGLPPAGTNRPALLPRASNLPVGRSSLGNASSSRLPISSGTAPGGKMQSETGQAGLLRLFNRQLAGQIAWFLPLAFLFVVLIPVLRIKGSHSGRLLLAYRFVLLWAAWLIPQAIFFSFAGLFHRYYLTMMAPAIAALVAAGFKVLWKAYQQDDWRRGLLPGALLVAALVQVVIIFDFPTFLPWFPWLLVVLTLVAVVVLLARAISLDMLRLVTLFTVAILCLAPLVWALVPVIYGGHSGLPYAGPELFETQRPGSEAETRLMQASALAEYLLEQQDDTLYLAAASSSQLASPLILLTGQPVMALGGFSGGDDILSVEEFAAWVDEGQVRFFVSDGVSLRSNPSTGKRASQSNRPQNLPRQAEITQWVSENCTPVAGFSLYDCGASVP